MTDLKHRILSRVSADLSDIEIAISQNLSPHLDLVSEVARHILFSGGKRLRPLLMVLSARICGYQESDAVPFSAIFEYLHAATLLHDDLVDGATLRRGQKAAHHIWGNPTAVLVGDFLLARSLSLAAKTEQPRIISTIAGITETMSQGEIHQLQLKGNPTITEADYMEVIRRKTAVLFEGACRSGALLADASEEKVIALGRYGADLGLAFQMADDLLDYVSNTRVLGKTVGADLREGKLTLPVIYALQKTGKEKKDWILDMISRSDFSVQDFESLVKILHESGGIDYTKTMAKRYVESAKDSIGIFSLSPTRNLLMDIADYALSRKM
ncbi:MAG: polyprenyl synthetase family protein [Desulfobacterales bacterium CG07_land_8_20_14_0_80_52_14]|nr:MAG: polyprenyl synthetase [Desulfobacterales bacterium CG23_combo_of_CG06-09_8_20_14_all_52_9]PIU48979.1 MAG: polyprenyl synthetase family protein [Desulfobacterales bacterium CG07_land_8_20_14_0_80_52_14]